jgi:cytochrome P450
VSLLPKQFIFFITAYTFQVCGHYVPPGVSVAVNQYAAFHSADNFAEPLRFIPERWLGDSRFVNDQKHVFQPFTIGPRACLGKK